MKLGRRHEGTDAELMMLLAKYQANGVPIYFEDQPSTPQEVVNIIRYLHECHESREYCRISKQEGSDSVKYRSVYEGLVDTVKVKVSVNEEGYDQGIYY